MIIRCLSIVLCVGVLFTVVWIGKPNAEDRKGEDSWTPLASAVYRSPGAPAGYAVVTGEHALLIDTASTLYLHALNQSPWNEQQPRAKEKRADQGRGSLRSPLTEQHFIRLKPQRPSGLNTVVRCSRWGGSAGSKSRQQAIDLCAGLLSLLTAAAAAVGCEMDRPKSPLLAASAD